MFALVQTMPSLFYSNNLEVSSSTVLDYANNYNKSFVNGYLPILNEKGKYYSADLFTTTVDAGRTYGYNTPIIDANDKFDLLDYASNKGDYDWFWVNWGAHSSPNIDEIHTNISPIHELTDSDFNGSNQEISERLLINIDDVGKIRDYRKTGEVTYLFRFAVTDDYSAPLVMQNDALDGKAGDAYMSIQTAFLDYKIIELTFQKEDKYKTIAVVSNPIDIFPGYKPPEGMPENSDVWEKLLKFIFTVISLVVLVILVRCIFKLLISANGNSATKSIIKYTDNAPRKITKKVQNKKTKKR